LQAFSFPSAYSYSAGVRVHQSIGELSSPASLHR
jgi:hypothetical protein